MTVHIDKRTAIVLLLLFIVTVIGIQCGRPLATGRYELVDMKVIEFYPLGPLEVQKRVLFDTRTGALYELRADTTNNEAIWTRAAGAPGFFE